VDTHFINTTTIDNNSIVYKELKVKHLKIIYKTLIGETPEPSNVINNFDNILCNITNLSKENILKFSIIDYFILLFTIRCTSIGDTIFAELTDTKNTKIEINIKHFIDFLLKVDTKKLLTPDTVTDFTIFYKIPSINDCITLNAEKKLDNLYSYFIHNITYKGVSINFHKKDYITKQLLLNQLPAKITAITVKRVYEIIETFNKINLLDNITPIKHKALTFNFNIDNLIFIIKLLFGDQLMSLYDNILALCKYCYFTPEYIEECTPGEYFLYVKKLKALNSKQDVNNPLPQNENFIDPFSELPPVTSRSEFTP
jgi:hypothetical protein